MTPTESVHRGAAAAPPAVRRRAGPRSLHAPRSRGLAPRPAPARHGTLAGRAHPRYLAGLAATGIGIERIPSIDEMNAKLARVGWSAVARARLHPAGGLHGAPEPARARHRRRRPQPRAHRVHARARHRARERRARADPRRPELRELPPARCGEVGFRAIASVEDQAVFEAIRNLSMVKEDPAATRGRGRARRGAARRGGRRRRATPRRRRARAGSTGGPRSTASSAPSTPRRIYGAGLLSSIGEAVHCLWPEVERVPLAATCADVPYDITRMQPQLFVARDFDAALRGARRSSSRRSPGGAAATTAST